MTKTDDYRSLWHFQAEHITCREMVHQARGCACRPQPDAPLAVLSPQMTEGRHCQVCLLDDRRLELLVQVGVATAHPASLCEPRGLCSVCWLICASEPVTQDCLRGLQSQYLPVLKSNYSLVTGFRNVCKQIYSFTSFSNKNLVLTNQSTLGPGLRQRRKILQNLGGFKE